MGVSVLGSWMGFSGRGVLVLVVALLAVGVAAAPKKDHLGVRADAWRVGKEMFRKGESKSWPDLVGKNGDEAREAILNEYPQLHVFIVGMGQPVTKDLRHNRVRIFVSEQGMVVAPPEIG